MKKNNLLYVLAAIFCTILWGSAFPAVKKGYELLSVASNADKLFFAGIRFLLAGLLLLLVCVIFQEKLSISSFSLNKNQLKWVLLLSVIQIVLNYAFYYIGLSNTAGSIGSIIAGADTFFAVFLASAFIKEEKLSFLKVLGCVLGFFGAAFGIFQHFEFSFSIFGEGFMFISAIFSAFGIIINKKASKIVPPFLLSALFLSIGGGMLLVFAVLFGGRIVLSLGGVLVLLYLCFVSAAAFGIWSWILKRQDVSKTSIFKLLIPVFGNAFSALILFENVFSFSRILSLVLISLGIIFVNLSGIKREKAKTENE